MQFTEPGLGSHSKLGLKTTSGGTAKVCTQTPGLYFLLKGFRGLPANSALKNPPANAGDTSSIPGPGRSHMPQSN